MTNRAENWLDQASDISTEKIYSALLNQTEAYIVVALASHIPYQSPRKKTLRLVQPNRPFLIHDNECCHCDDCQTDTLADCFVESLNFKDIV